MHPRGSETSDNTDTAAETSMPCDETENVQQPPNEAALHRITLADIESRNDIDGLTVRQLKCLLVNHYVDYKGCCEKQELVDRVHELWTDHRKLNDTGESVVLGSRQKEKWTYSLRILTQGCITGGGAPKITPSLEWSGPPISLSIGSRSRSP